MTIIISKTTTSISMSSDFKIYVDKACKFKNYQKYKAYNYLNTYNSNPYLHCRPQIIKLVQWSYFLAWMLLYYLLYNIKIKSKTSKPEPLKKNTREKKREKKYWTI